MPNGGSDCCGTCWFNRKNRGEAGYAHSRDPEPDVCEIRELAIANPFYTYCANHPHRFPEGERIPVGPVLTQPLRGGREIWQLSPDTPEIRSHLLELLAKISEQPTQEYPASPQRDEVIVWQLGEWREQRAELDLERIAAFDPQARSGTPLQRSQASLVKSAQAALQKIRGATGG